MEARASSYLGLLMVSLLCSELVVSIGHNQQRNPIHSRGFLAINSIAQSRLVDDNLAQRQMQISEYENLGQTEDSFSKKSTRATSDQQKVVPSSENNGNSQVVYVNLARVVNDRNDTERVISTQQQLIKQDGQILCGETNRNGNPSPNPTNDSLQNRIVGGNKADPGEFPYQVRLNIRSRRGSSLCGGVIIDKRHILTAAHCMTTW